MKYLLVLTLLSVGIGCSKPQPAPIKPTVVTIPDGKQVTINCPQCNHEIRVTFPECQRLHLIPK